MQVQANKTASTLQQGSIFTLQNLKIFKGEEPASLFGEGSFYPEVNSDSSDLGIIFSQSCDVYRNPAEDREPKVPYLSIGILETFEKYFKSSAFKYDFGLDIANYSYRLQISSQKVEKTYRFIDSDALEKRFEKVFNKTIQNNHPYLFFINLSEDDVSEDLYVTNLLKIFPIKIRHYDSILKCVTHELRAEFANKLGWRIASLYGQIGTTDYKETQVKIFCKKLSKKFASGLREAGCSDLFVKAEVFEKAKSVGSKKPADKLAFLQENIELIQGAAT